MPSNRTGTGFCETIQKLTRWPEGRSPDVLQLEVLPVVRVLEAHFSEVLIGWPEVESLAHHRSEEQGFVALNSSGKHTHRRIEVAERRAAG